MTARHCITCDKVPTIFTVHDHRFGVEVVLRCCDVRVSRTAAPIDAPNAAYLAVIEQWNKENRPAQPEPVVDESLAY